MSRETLAAMRISWCRTAAASTHIGWKLLCSSRLIPQIISADIRKCFPARFNGEDCAFLAAEAAADLLVNSAPTTEDDMDLDK